MHLYNENYKLYHYTLLLLFIFKNGIANGGQGIKKDTTVTINQILKNIHKPEFKNASYNILSFGAVLCDSARSAFICFENNYHGSRGGHYPTLFNNFKIENVNCNYSGVVGIYAAGIKGHSLANLFLKNVTVLKIPRPQIIDNIWNLVYSHVIINGTDFKKPSITGYEQLHTD